jgi:hypothetical protein
MAGWLNSGAKTVKQWVQILGVAGKLMCFPGWKPVIFFSDLFLSRFFKTKFLNIERGILPGAQSINHCRRDFDVGRLPVLAGCSQGAPFSADFDRGSTPTIWR